MWHADGGLMGGMWLWGILGLVLVVLAGWVMARLGGGPGPASGTESPEALLKGRYARGEIDRDEYERRLNDLRK